MARNKGLLRARGRGIWVGFTFTYDGRKAAVRRSHGNWLAVAYDRRGRLSSGEYFSYGEPGSLAKAKAWCEQRLLNKKGH